VSLAVLAGVFATLVTLSVSRGRGDRRVPVSLDRSERSRVELARRRVRLDISTEKTEYDRNEPIIIRIIAKSIYNENSKNQWICYGTDLYDECTFKVVVSDPHGLPVSPTREGEHRIMGGTGNFDHDPFIDLRGSVDLHGTFRITEAGDYKVVASFTFRPDDQTEDLTTQSDPLFFRILPKGD
jgi:hypothetical protein